MPKKFPKLIRDRIPEILAAKGKAAKTRILTDDEYLKFLLKKMVEESIELSQSSGRDGMRDELADILELIDAIVKFKGWKKRDIIAVQKGKRKKNGGFEKKILLLKKS
jgi:predicted house-cleaning noncanonical NTP pyrophosphatase (MazG superfamily)